MLRGPPSLALLTFALFLGACTTGPPRVYYGPVGAEFGDTIGEWSFENERASILVRCQGSYLNEVGGRRVRTVHLQLIATRTTGEAMTLPLKALQLDVLVQSAEPPSPLPVSAVWQGSEQLTGALIVPPWSRRAVDLFFDDLAFTVEKPELLRLRFSLRDGDGGLQLYECQFFPLAVDDPRRPGDQELHDPGFGYRDGYYYPGWGALGQRRLRTAGEVRLFHLFHDPDEGFFW